jgi:hypothetical protein
MNFDKWQNLNFNKLTSEYDDYCEACDTQFNTPMEFDEWCLEKFNKLDNSDEAYERFKDNR